ncbi:MAG TPA: Lrp/AsnC family transcriptional regulator [Methanomassiliicoccales archaeon]|nr:Lrp/AsnC family transcriptional regulator [Methanomassiliicoccales archaeon]
MQDELDAQIIHMLQKDAKLTYEQIAEKLARSPSTIRDRIKKMEDDRVILGYSAVVDEARMGVGADAYISADIEAGQLPAAVASLMSLRNVTEIMHLTGERRVLLRVRATSNKELMDLVDKKIRPLGFSNPEVTIVLGTVLRYPGV